MVCYNLYTCPPEDTKQSKAEKEIIDLLTKYGADNPVFRIDNKDFIFDF